MKNHAVVVVGLVLACSVTGAMADDRPYTDGPVSNLSYIKVKPGKFNDYMRYLGSNYKAIMDANMKAGLVLNYGVYSAQARGPRDADIILRVTYKNMAAFDRSDEFEALQAKVVGSIAVRSQGAIDREAMRELLGSELVREMILK